MSEACFDAPSGSVLELLYEIGYRGHDTGAGPVASAQAMRSLMFVKP